ncbi:hypothetical protein CO654_34290 [Rhizobium sp. L18]|nr:hypothetical protein CO654_34290 [Rhizobium sp. L18]
MPPRGLIGAEAARLDATMLYLWSGDFVVDLAIYDAHSGERLARAGPDPAYLPTATSPCCRRQPHDIRDVGLFGRPLSTW